MSAIRVVVIGANPANVEEIQHVVAAAIGDNADIFTATIDNYRSNTDADMVVCLVNRQQEIESVFGSDKVVALKLVPPTEYFLQISRIQPASSVIVFNNSTSGTDVLMELLRKYDLMHVHYEILPYDELDFEQVAAKVSAAKYITGGIAYVGEGKTLYTKFGEYLSDEVLILVSPPRIATSESISRLSHAFSSLYHKTVMDELKRLSAVDYLTQIPNRRTFDETLDIEWNRAMREQTTLALGMIDIDYFKNYNDHYGHLAGDECIKVIAHVIKSMMRRPADFCARYGGEEFAVILPNIDIEGAKQVLEKIRSAVMSCAIKHDFSLAASVVTISIGWALDRPAGDTANVESLLSRADKALYQAKIQGRNQTVMSAE